MIAFLVAAGGLLLLSLLFVLWPLWRGATVAASRREANIAVYEQHVADIEREVDAGQITSVDGRTRRDELGARLLSDVDDEPGTVDVGAAPRPWLASAVVIAGFVALAFGLYGMLGDPRGLALRATPDISALVAQMEARLATVPNDTRTRILLAQVQMTQRNYDAAAQTLAQLNAQMDTPDTALLLAEARARVLGNGGAVNPRAQALYEQVLTLAPDNAEALWFAGLAALSDGRPRDAVRRWQHLLEQDLPADFRARVEQRLAEVQGDKPSLQPAN